jgi:hypothetical protein
LTDNRAKTVLLEIQKMTLDPARPRINRIKAMVDPAYFDSSSWLSGGETIEELIEQIGVNAGLSTAIVITTGGGATPSGFTTAIEKAWNVMVSAAEMGGSSILVARDSQIHVAPDDFWVESVGGYTPDYTWTRANVSSVEMLRTGGGMVSQVKLTWETPDGSDGGVAMWPSAPDKLGSVLELGKLYFANSAAATLAARKRYFISRYPYEFVVTLAAGNFDVAARQLALLQWQFADDMQATDRLVLIRQAQHYCEGQTLGTVAHCIQIDRESDG